MDNSKYINYTSVKLDADKCNGCINCMKRCPTEAIRVRDGKARIMYERCVGCGECIKICPANAKVAVHDAFADINRFKYRIAVPSPAIYGQFNNLTDINYVLTGLKEIGFDDVFESAVGCEIASEVTRVLLKENKLEKPIIGSACSAVIKLITVRYEHLLSHLSPVLEPEEIAAGLARERAIKEKGIAPDDIGVFVISPCVANVFSFKGGDVRDIDGVLSFADIYQPLLAAMNKIRMPEPLSRAGRLGLAWARTEGEARGTGSTKYLAADGIENIINVLEELELGKLGDLEFIELAACPGGCVGGILNIENPFLASARIRSLQSHVSITLDHGASENIDAFVRKAHYEPVNVFKLSENRLEAMDKLMRMEQVLKSLPGLDCGSCGAPSCRAFAEDVVKGIKANCRYKNNDGNK